MLKIQHRVNTIEQLVDTPKNYGVEVDIRYEKNDLILHHDPYQKGILFSEWLENYNHTFIILNTKSEGLEAKILQLLGQFNIEDYFFLDLSIPFMVKQIKNANSNIAVRFSEYEPLELAMSFKGLVKWVWVDCFSKLPLDHNTYNKLKSQFKICLVSPELQGHPYEFINQYTSQVKGMEIDAVCTKKPELWS